MSSSAVNTFTDPDVYHEAIRDTQADGVVTGRGNFRVDQVTIRLDQLSLQRAKETLPRLTYSAIDPKQFAIVFLTHPGQQGYIAGREWSPGEIIVYGVGSEGHNRLPAACQWGSIALRHEDVAAAGQTVIGRELIAPPFTQPIKPPPLLLSRLLSLHEAAGHLAKMTPDILAKAEVGRAVEQGLIEAMVSCLARGDPGDNRYVHRHHSTVMRRLERALEANPEEPLYMAELCAAAGVSYPTLRICCQEHLGMGPKRYLLLRRMHLARQALRRADPEKTSVTTIATDYGFWELGRFSVAYRSLFGESPSTTLRRPAADRELGENAGSRWEFTKSA